MDYSTCAADLDNLCFKLWLFDDFAIRGALAIVGLYFGLKLVLRLITFITDLLPFF